MIMHTDFGQYRPLGRLEAAAKFAFRLALIMGLSLVCQTIALADDDDDDDDDGGHRICARTTSKAFNACKAEVKDDFFITVGKCLNTEDPAEREECVDEAREERKESNVLCRQQRRGRKDVCKAIGQGPYDPDFDPDNFVDADEAAANPNPYFPLVPGTYWVYEAEDEIIRVDVLDEVKVIEEVECRTVRDVVTIDGLLVEDTSDWYAQDEEGNLWYCGEISQNFAIIPGEAEAELVDLEGSWKTGRDDAKAGIIIFSEPEVGTTYRQEYDLGNAEDIGEIVSTTGTAETSSGEFGCDGDCLITRDYTPIEPDAAELKIYAPGIGLILELDAETNEVGAELVEFSTP